MVALEELRVKVRREGGGDGKKSWGHITVRTLIVGSDHLLKETDQAGYRKTTGRVPC